MNNEGNGMRMLAGKKPLKNKNKSSGICVFCGGSDGYHEGDCCDE